jgi:hypothetical protein
MYLKEQENTGVLVREVSVFGVAKAKVTMYPHHIALIAIGYGTNTKTLNIERYIVTPVGS